MSATSSTPDQGGADDAPSAASVDAGARVGTKTTRWTSRSTIVAAVVLAVVAALLFLASFLKTWPFPQDTGPSPEAAASKILDSLVHGRIEGLPELDGRGGVAPALTDALTPEAARRAMGDDADFTVHKDRIKEGTHSATVPATVFTRNGKVEFELEFTRMRKELRWEAEPLTLPALKPSAAANGYRGPQALVVNGVEVKTPSPLAGLYERNILVWPGAVEVSVPASDADLWAFAADTPTADARTQEAVIPVQLKREPGPAFVPAARQAVAERLAACSGAADRAPRGCDFPLPMVEGKPARDFRSTTWTVTPSSNVPDDAAVRRAGQGERAIFPFTVRVEGKASTDSRRSWQPVSATLDGEFRAAFGATTDGGLVLKSGQER